MIVDTTKMRPDAKTFAAIDKGGPIAPSLRALWSWSDGVKDPVFFDATSDSIEEDEGLYFLSVKQSTAETKMSAKHGLAAGTVPFATDLAGNFLCVESASGRVVSWDHETRKATHVAASLEAYLASSTKAAKLEEGEKRVGLRTRREARLHPTGKTQGKRLRRVVPGPLP